MMPEIVLIGGSRDPTRGMIFAAIDYINTLPNDVIVLHGGAAGIDSWARNTARSRGMVVKECLPDYEHLGKKAPLERNKEMADYCDRAVFFWDGQSRGTWHAINEVRKRGKPLDVFVQERKVEDLSTLKPPPRKRTPRQEVALT